MQWIKESERKPPVANVYYCRWVEYPLSKFVCVFSGEKFQVQMQGEIEWLDESMEMKELYDMLNLMYQMGSENVNLSKVKQLLEKYKI